MSGSVDQYSLVVFSEKMTIEDFPIGRCLFALRLFPLGFGQRKVGKNRQDFEVAYKLNADLFLIAKSGRNTGMVKNHPEFIFYLQQIGHIL